jgi:hypothetical protein
VVKESVAEAYGRRWSAGAAVRAEHFAALSRPAWEAVLTAVGVGEGTASLDVACGSERHLGPEGTAAALATAAAPFRRADGSYLFHSTFRWVVARRD